MAKKFLTLFLVIALMLSTILLVACGGGGDNKDSGTKPSESTPSDTQPGGQGGDTTPGSDSQPDTKPSPYLDNLPEGLNFAGEAVSFLASPSYYVIEDLENFNSADVISNSVYVRETEVMDRFGGIEITATASDGSGDTNAKWKADVQGEAHEYDIMDGHMRFNGNLALQGLNLNITKLQYVDLEQDYWNHSYRDAWNYKGYQFWVTGDITYDFLSEMVAVYVNKDLFDKYHPTENLFEVVTSGEWTYSKALEYINGVAEDTDQDGTVGGTDTDDMHGWVFQNGWSISSLAYSGGFQLTSKQGTKFKVDLASARNEAIYKDFYALVNSEFSIKTSEDAKPVQNGLAIFSQERMYRMQDEAFSRINFMVIPCPKYEASEPYRTASYDGVPILGIEISLQPDRYDFIGAFFEAYAAAGKKYTTEGFYEAGLRSRYAQDEETYICLGIIRAAGWIDFAYAWANTMQSLYTAPGDAAQGGAATMAAYAAGVQSSEQKMLDGLYTNLSKASKS